MANPFPFTAGQVLTAAQMNGIGETVSFTPTWSGLTVGNGTLTYATYVRVQNLVFMQITFVLGSTSAVTGNISVTAPVTPATLGQNAIGEGLIADVSTGVLYTTISSMAAGEIQVFPIDAGGAYATTAQASATIPMTWATGDVITFCGTYRVA